VSEQFVLFYRDARVVSARRSSEESRSVGRVGDAFEHGEAVATVFEDYTAVSTRRRSSRGRSAACGYPPVYR
jgi:hypothetical protein